MMQRVGTWSDYQRGDSERIRRRKNRKAMERFWQATATTHCRKDNEQISSVFSTTLCLNSTHPIEDWVIYRGALNVEEAEAFTKEGVIPNLFLWIDVADEILVERFVSIPTLVFIF